MYKIDEPALNPRRVLIHTVSDYCGIQESREF